jgi:kynurenine formamidase
MIIDLSHPIRRDSFVYPGLPPPEVSQFRSHLTKGPPYAPGTSFEITRVNFVTNLGTYVDSPYHRHEDGADFTGVSLDRLADLEGVVIDTRRRQDRPIGPEFLGQAGLAGRAVLFLTGWSDLWNTPQYSAPGPYLTRQTVERLVGAEPALVGIDCMNIDNVDDPERPAHTLLLRHGIPVVEHLTNLDQVLGQAFRFFALPPAWQKVASFPVRAVAVL